MARSSHRISPHDARCDGARTGGGLRRSEVTSAALSDETCDACGEVLTEPAAGRGLLLFPKGDRMTVEEPPLCESCARAIGLSALMRFGLEMD